MSSCSSAISQPWSFINECNYILCNRGTVLKLLELIFPTRVGLNFMLDMLWVKQD